jgi:hypothetical protein
MRRRHTRRSTSPPSAVRDRVAFHTRKLPVDGRRVLAETTALIDMRARLYMEGAHAPARPRGC